MPSVVELAVSISVCTDGQTSTELSAIGLELLSMSCCGKYLRDTSRCAHQSATLLPPAASFHMIPGRKQLLLSIEYCIDAWATTRRFDIHLRVFADSRARV